jgi:3-oxoacyl-[acyl-carrier protein] reductase
MESVYSASKSALIGLSVSLAKELEPSNVRVNCICPGVIDTAMNKNFSFSEMQDIILDIPFKRIGSCKEVADLVTFLVSDKAKSITGEVITLDGGYTL